ncbi:hypothetical protein [Pseudoponticoccus marisrubri]|uniref:Uncharacterized protein n=1 Tax=Pseudoponticoccus marisrubri TaxID=1685382 RepID=A0A0W7WMM2_9RHOB|nr:hypothetical protein [Pseudoponticoccus marisrubri]KUF11819.1 hypothetical protein AVJ23_04355 [Pseudoponticoccus marisrubri]
MSTGEIAITGTGMAGDDITARAVLRLGLAVLGGGLMLSALGIWLVGDAQGGPGLALVKLGVSLFMMMAGLCCVSLSRRPRGRARRAG